MRSEARGTAGSPLQLAAMVFTVAIPATTPNGLTRPVLDRIPAILRPDAQAVWLDPAEKNPDKLMPLVGTYTAELLAADAAHPALNGPSFEGPDCLVPPAA